MFAFFYSFQIIPPSDSESLHNVRISSYDYRVLDSAGSEIIAFHWHPTGISRVRDPHLHLSSKLRPVPIGQAGDEAPLASMHVPTGFVPLADVVRFLIDEFGIEPLRDDWSEVLASRRDLSSFPAS